MDAGHFGQYDKSHDPVYHWIDSELYPICGTIWDPTINTMNIFDPMDIKSRPVSHKTGKKYRLCKHCEAAVKQLELQI